jgi:transposase
MCQISKAWRPHIDTSTVDEGWRDGAGLGIADKGAKSEGAKMKQKSGPDKAPAEQVPKNIRRQTPKVFCGREDPHCAGRAAWWGEHLGALPPRGYRRLDVLRLVEGVPGGRETPVGGRHGPCEVKDLRREATALKEVVADLTLENHLLKKLTTLGQQLGQLSRCFRRAEFHAAHAVQYAALHDVRDDRRVVLDGVPSRQFGPPLQMLWTLQEALPRQRYRRTRWKPFDERCLDWKFHS